MTNVHTNILHVIIRKQTNLEKRCNELFFGCLSLMVLTRRLSFCLHMWFVHLLISKYELKSAPFESKKK